MPETDFSPDARGLERPDRPSGGFAAIFWDHDCQLAAVKTHAVHEGHEVNPRAVLDSYDRAIHPWLHGRRPPDLAKRLRSWWSRWVR